MLNAKTLITREKQLYMNLDSPSAEGYPTWLCWHQRLKAGRRDTKVYILVFELYRRPEMYLQFSTTHTPGIIDRTVRMSAQREVERGPDRR